MQTMKNILAALILFVFTIQLAAAQEFKREIEIPGTISAYKFVEDNAGNYAVIGNSFDVKNKYRFSFVLKVSPNGEVIFMRKFGENDKGHKKVFFTDVISTQNNELVVVGSKYDNSINKGYIIGLDPEFNVMWEELYQRDPKNPNSMFKGITTRKDGKFVISGTEHDMEKGSGYKDLFVVMDEFGRVEAGKSYKLSDKFDVNKTNTRTAPKKQKSSFRLNAMMDTSSATQENYATYFINNHPDYSHMRGVAKVKDKFYINTIKHDKQGATPGGDYIHELMVLNANYDTVARHTLHQNNALKKTSGGLAFAEGLSGSANAKEGHLFSVNSFNLIDRRHKSTSGYSKVYLAKTDLEGKVIWEREFENSQGNIHAKGVLATKDGGALIMGYFEKGGKSANRNLYLIKVDEKGVANSVKPEFNESNRVVASPNPTSGPFQFGWEIDQNAKWNVKVYNLNGQVVKNQDFAAGEIGSLDISDQPAGTFLYTIETEKSKYYTGKIIKK